MVEVGEVRVYECETCLHRDICKYKEDYKELVDHYENLGEIHSSLSLSCTKYKSDICEKDKEW